MRFLSLDHLVASDHRVRLVWQYCESLDLKPLYQRIKSTQGKAGRNPIDPRILFALWFYATLEGISSARRIDDLTTRDFHYMWICGGVSVNHHTLSDFRSENAALLEKLLTDSIAALLNQKLITLETLRQDGMRVRASAGSASFRSAPTLQKMQAAAEDYLKELLERSEQESAEASKAQQAAQQRSAEERLERIKAALENLRHAAGDTARRRGHGTPPGTQLCAVPPAAVPPGTPPGTQLCAVPPAAVPPGTQLCAAVPPGTQLMTNSLWSPWRQGHANMPPKVCGGNKERGDNALRLRAAGRRFF
jgi:transposase